MALYSCFRDRTMVVTGGVQGIGLAISKAALAQGAQVVALDIDDEAASLAKQSLGADETSSFFFIEADTSVESDVAQAFDRIADRSSGVVHYLVNCAGQFIKRSVEASWEEWHRALNVNVVGYGMCAKYASRLMPLGGAIVNIASISGHIAQPQHLTYTATKGAVLSMTRGLALDLADRGIRVNSVSPGTIWTESYARLLQETRSLDRAAADSDPQVGGLHVLGRCGDVSEVADTVMFLLSDQASFVTGADLPVDGGYLAI